jgi:hypothetical protein
MRVDQGLWAESPSGYAGTDAARVRDARYSYPLLLVSETIESNHLAGGQRGPCWKGPAQLDRRMRRGSRAHRLSREIREHEDGIWRARNSGRPSVIVTMPLPFTGVHDPSVIAGAAAIHA